MSKGPSIDVDIVLDLHPAQRDIFRGAKRFNVVRCGRRFGKTVLALAILGSFVGQAKPIAYLAPTYKMLSDVWREAKRTFAPIIKDSNEQEKRITLVTGDVIDFWSLDNFDAIRGRKYACIVVDEAAMVRNLEEAWTMTLRPTLADYAGSAWFLSTPKGKNYFWTLDLKSQTDPTWASFHAPSSANPYIAAEELEAFRNDLPTIAYQQEVLAEYVDVAGALLRREYLRYADTIPDGLNIGMGVDLAISTGTYADYTAAVVVGHDRETGTRYVLDVARGQYGGLPEIKRFIEAMAAKWNPRRINIEQVQFQAVVVKEMLKGSLPVKAVKPDKDKVTRFHNILARYEQGMVMHAHGLQREFEDELLAFPMGPHDDMVDALVYADQAATKRDSVGVLIT